MSPVKKEKKQKSAEFMKETAEHATPHHVIKAARYVMGEIDLDVASSEYFNYHVVKAKRFFTKEDDALRQRWGGRVFCNPPGNADDVPMSPYRNVSLPRLFWEHGVGHMSEDAITCFFWVGFNPSQLQVLQASPMNPLQFITNFPNERLDYLVRPKKTLSNGDVIELNGPPAPQGAPARPSYLTLIPPRDTELARGMVKRFIEVAEDSMMVPGQLVEGYESSRPRVRTFDVLAARRSYR